MPENSDCDSTTLGNDGQRTNRDQITGTCKGRLKAAEIYAKLHEQEYRCAISGRQLQPETASIDHVMPLSRGGKNAIENIQILHCDVNRAKGTLTNAEFVSLCKEVASRFL